jgi:hypothetical protein
LLLKIDAAVLDAYGLPARLERQVLDFFNSEEGASQRRAVPFDFGNYFPSDFKSCFPLSEFISASFSEGSVGNLLDRSLEQDEK